MTITNDDENKVSSHPQKRRNRYNRIARKVDKHVKCRTRLETISSVVIPIGCKKTQIKRSNMDQESPSSMKTKITWWWRENVEYVIDTAVSMLVRKTRKIYARNVNQTLESLRVSSKFIRVHFFNTIEKFSLRFISRERALSNVRTQDVWTKLLNDSDTFSLGHSAIDANWQDWPS